MPSLGKPAFFVMNDLEILDKSWQLTVFEEMPRGGLGMTLQIRSRRMNTDESAFRCQGSRENIKQWTQKKMDTNDQVPAETVPFRNR